VAYLLSYCIYNIYIFFGNVQPLFLGRCQIFWTLITHCGGGVFKRSDKWARTKCNITCRNKLSTQHMLSLCLLRRASSVQRRASSVAAVSSALGVSRRCNGEGRRTENHSPKFGLVQVRRIIPQKIWNKSGGGNWELRVNTQCCSTVVDGSLFFND
jgi:hypothetical protein